MAYQQVPDELYFSSDYFWRSLQRRIQYAWGYAVHKSNMPQQDFGARNILRNNQQLQNLENHEGAKCKLLALCYEKKRRKRAFQRFFLIICLYMYIQMYNNYKS